MTTKHTPGPWTVENASGRMLWIGALRIPDDERYGLHTIITGIDIEDLTTEARERKEANAHLIAAAPDLLAALEAISPLLPRSLTTTAHGDPSWTEAIRKVEDAIAKAKRRQVEWRRRRKGEKP